MTWRWVLLLAGSTTAYADTPLQPPTPRDPKVPIEEKNPPPPTIRKLDNIPDGLLTAKPWIGRRYMTGAMLGRRPHDTFTLQHDGKQALLTHEIRVGTKWAGGNQIDAEVLAWRTESLIQYLGTIEEKGEVVKLTLANGTDKLEWTCKKTKVAAARPDAVRDRTPGVGGCEGDRGRWVPAATKRVNVIRCSPFDEPKPSDTDAVEEWEKLAFALAPGIEWLHVNDDCVIQGGGWRMVPADGSITAPRPKAKRVAPAKAPRPVQ